MLYRFWALFLFGSPFLVCDLYLSDLSKRCRLRYLWSFIFNTNEIYSVQNTSNCAPAEKQKRHEEFIGGLLLTNTRSIYRRFDLHACTFERCLPNRMMNSPVFENTWVAYLQKFCMFSIVLIFPMLHYSSINVYLASYAWDLYMDTNSQIKVFFQLCLINAVPKSGLVYPCHLWVKQSIPMVHFSPIN